MYSLSLWDSKNNVKKTINKIYLKNKKVKSLHKDLLMNEANEGDTSFDLIKISLTLVHIYIYDR